MSARSAIRRTEPASCTTICGRSRKPGNAIEQGHRLFAVSPSTGVEVEVELHGEGIRLKSGESAGHDLDALPTCG